MKTLAAALLLATAMTCSVAIADSETGTPHMVKDVLSGGEKGCVRVTPRLPNAPIRTDLQGVVKAQITVLDGKVTDVKILSGLEHFHATVIEALTAAQCWGSFTATQDFTFRLK